MPRKVAPPGREPQKRKRPTPATLPDLKAARRLQHIATGLLVLMGGLLLAATWAAGAISPHFLWLTSFAEAALVGGLADWFAVTALFRHPLGLPIPHTAIIPRSKDRIGKTLAKFLQENFLIPTVLARQLVGLDTARLLADFLAGEKATISKETRRLLQGLLATDAASEIGECLKEGALRQLRKADIAPLLGRLLEAQLRDHRHLTLVSSLIVALARFLDGQEALIRQMVHERTNWLLNLVNIDSKIAETLLKGLTALLGDMAADPQHPVRRRAGRALVRLAYALQHDPETGRKVEALKHTLLANPALGSWVDGLLADSRESLGQFMESDTAQSLVVHIARSLQQEKLLAAAVNDIARRAILGLVATHGDAIVGLVSETVARWDAATVTDKLESAVLRDLQYIRFNGTLIGGLIGVLLHAILLVAG